MATLARAPRAALRRPPASPNAVMRLAGVPTCAPPRPRARRVKQAGGRACPVLIAARPSAGRRAPTTACWSLEVSLATSALVIGTVGTLLVRRASPRDVGNAIFLGVFGSMQIVDATLWALDRLPGGLAACDLNNRIWTRAGILIILLEPIAALVGTNYAARKKPSLLEVALYSTIFLITPITTTFIGDDVRDVPCSALASPGQVASCFGAREQWSKSFQSVLFQIDSKCACTAVTPDHHLLYGGQNLLYYRFVTPLDSVRTCEAPTPDGPVMLRGSNEIPVIIRLMFLASMAVPYAVKVKPRACGLSHAAILVATWMVGFFSDSHASVWCLANVAQSALMLADPYIWPPQEEDRGSAPKHKGREGERPWAMLAARGEFPTAWGSATAGERAEEAPAPPAPPAPSAPPAAGGGVPTVVPTATVPAEEGEKKKPPARPAPPAAPGEGAGAAPTAPRPPGAPKKTGVDSGRFYKKDLVPSGLDVPRAPRGIPSAPHLAPPPSPGTDAPRPSTLR